MKFVDPIKISDDCRIYRDIDKHPLPADCWIDVKLTCGSVLIKCYAQSFTSGIWVHWNHEIFCKESILQWRKSK